MRRTRPLIPWLLCMLAAGSVPAAHITDKLVVGIYAQPSAAGSPLKLLSSGTPLEVLKTQDGYSQVRLADDTEGWVANTYITEEKPAKAMLLETQAKLRQMGIELAALREKQPNAAQGTVADSPPVVTTPAADDAPPTAREAQLRQSLSKAEARIAELEQQVADRPVVEDAQQRLQVMRGRVQQALHLLADAQGVELSPTEPAAQSLIGRYQAWIVGLIMLLVGFGAGVAFIDYRIRKRYGGFRI